MNIEIYSGQPQSNVSKIFNDRFGDLIENKNGLHLVFPERIYFHPKTLYDTIYLIIKKCIKKNVDIYILTYSVDVLNAVRVAIKEKAFVGAKVHQYLNDNTDLCATVNIDGRLTVWAEDIFDTWENALDKLIF